MAKLTLFGVRVMWYVIQVTTGKEEEAKAAIERVVDDGCYERCFYLRRERVWRRGGECIEHIESLFPGYLFIDTETPEEVFEELRQIPKLTKLLRSDGAESGNVFLPVEADERELLENLIAGDEEDVVRLSEVELDEENHIVSVKGPLEKYVDRIVTKKTRLRYVVIQIRLLGKMREILIGIKLKEESDE